MSDEDQIPDPLASMDQLLRGLADMARAMRTYYNALEEQGFAPEQALLLTIAFQTQVQRGTAE